MSLRRAALIAVLVLLMAVTPLSAVLSGGAFDVWLGNDGRGPVRVTLEDQTGLVRLVVGVSTGNLGGVSNPGGNQRLLSVNLVGGCGDYWIHLTFSRAAGGYRIDKRTDEFGCSFLNLEGHGTVVMSLLAPVDASTVQFRSSPFVALNPA